jgi:PAS domain S-box-containing protein
MMKNKPVILVVDDQLQNIKLLEGLLVRQGYEIIQAESGEEALEKLSGNQVDLVLLDVKMPRMSGFEVLTKLRADKKTQRIPVIMITAHNENEARVKALESGCDDFISKPFDQYELLARVKSLLRIKFLNDEVDEAREFAESVINTVREPLISLDQDLRVVTVSRSFYEFFKVKPEETVGQLIYALGNKQWDIPKLRELLETILPQHTTFDNYEVEHEFATIGRRIMLLNARQIQRGFGKERIILLAIEDVTERKRLEDLLTESEMRYRRIFETASDGIVLLEKNEGHIVHANPAAEKMLGYSEGEYVGKMLQDIGVSLDMSDFRTIMQSLNKNGIINYDDVEVRTKSGHSINTEIYMVDRAKLAQCNIRDVTERKRADEKLKEEKAFIESALNTLKDIFFVFDLEGRFLRWNEAMIAVSGYIDTEIALMKPVDLFRNDDIERVSKAIRETVEEDSSSIDAILVTKDGRQIPHEMKTSLLRDHTGNLIGICGVGRDLTERYKLEAQLLHSQKMEAVGTLAGGIAHDFNNMLNVIMGYGTLVMNKLEAGSPSKEHINQVLIAADRAANLAKRLLVFSKKQLIEVKSINVNELILNLQKMLVRIIRESIDFNLDLADMPLIVLADAGQIEQVLINLAVNAEDAMQGGGRLTISTEFAEMDDEYVALCGYGKPGRYALVTVADTGHGMDAGTQKKIFEPFFTTKGIGEGTGLGLAISYGIIKQHCGFINVYSEPGQGTVFKIYLPLSKEAASPDRKMEADVPVMGGNETVLVAEDDASLRELTRIILESFGYSVISAEDGEDAITKFMENKERISLVLLDMIMPKKNGKEVSEAIRKVNPGIKILFESGYTMGIIKTDELTEGSFDFIHKPFQPRNLLIKVREVLDR